MNFFSHQSAAERYAAARPYLHPIIVQRIRETTGLQRFENVLDVGCGTGQSTSAVAEYSDRVIGADVSWEMLSQATPVARIDYLKAQAEQLPFADHSFSLITVGLAFHWFEQERFLAEARRVLKNSGHLIIYNNGFLGQLSEQAGFRDWNREQYLTRYPIPSRKNRVIDNEWVSPLGFEVKTHNTFETGVLMTHEQLVGYLLTQSNVIAAVEQGSERLDEVANWIHRETLQFFGKSPRTAEFRIHIDYLKVI